MSTSFPLRLLGASTLLAVLIPVAAAGQTPAAGTATKPGAPAAPATAASLVTAVTDDGWPRDVRSGTTRITVYQPQIDSWDGFRLAARAATAVVEKAGASPTYGIIQIRAATHVDKNARLVSLENLTIEAATFPTVDPEKARRWALAVQQQSATMRPMSLERFEAAVAVSNAAKRADSVPVRNEVPNIHIATTPSMLILIDGDPVYREVAGVSLTRIINTRPLVLKDGGGKHYLKVFDGWMEASALTGPYAVAASVPTEVTRALQAVVALKVADLLVGGDPNDPKSAPSLKQQAPHIVVDTRASELLVFDGQPKYAPIEGTQLMYAENTTGNVFIDAGDQRAYILVSGRWFRGSSNLRGPWEFVASSALPKDFAAIPDTSGKENVKASIAGTEQAEEAIVANSIPQTAEIKRSEARFSPTYDGEPKLAAIESTTMQYVVNASQPVIAVGSPFEYFGVENGTWFVASNLHGPWLVATTVPAEIYSIPVSSPLHYVTYVRIYDSNPEYVVVGYTPGYTGTYVSNGVIVYGTGYYYTPWIGTYWYGPPVTYGFGVSFAYTPWGGWAVGFGFGWSWGAATVAVGWGWGPYPWWGEYGWGGYYPWVYGSRGVAWGPRGGAAVWGPGYWSGTTGNIYHRWGSTTAVTRRAGGYNAWTGNRWAGQAGRAYNSRTGIAAAGQRGVVGNVYTGNYAAGQRGAAINTRTGTAVAGRTGEIGNVYTGRNVKAGQGVVRGPGGNTTSVAGIKGNNAGMARVGDDVYAGRDGHVYRHNGDGWEPMVKGANRPSFDPGQLDRERLGRSQGNFRTGAARSGGFHGATGGRRMGGRRR